MDVFKGDGVHRQGGHLIHIRAVMHSCGTRGRERRVHCELKDNTCVRPAGKGSRGRGNSNNDIINGCSEGLLVHDRYLAPADKEHVVGYSLPRQSQKTRPHLRKWDTTFLRTILFEAFCCQALPLVDPKFEGQNRYAGHGPVAPSTAQ